MKRNFLIFQLWCLLFVFSERAISQQAEEYVVKKGDNLWRIARTYQATEKGIMELNGMNSNIIKPGQVILIPLKEKISNRTEPQEAKGEEVRHYVKKGDNLWSIARKYGVKIEEIKEKNNLPSISLKPGEILLIPARTTNVIAFENIKPLPDINKVNIENIPLPARENFITHKVKYGDNLWDISRKYGAKIEEIKTANNLSGNLIKPGETLLIPSSSIEEPLSKKITKHKSKRQEKRKEESVISEEELEKIKEERSKIVVLASRYLGVRYRWGGTTASGFDCSGFVKHVYSQVGENLPRSSWEQFNVGTPIEKSELKPGDRVFFTTYRRGPSHVGIYIGEGKFIHASSKRGSRYVKIDNLNSAFYTRKYIGAKRPRERYSD